jgi:homoserine acetyltransferase
MPSLHIKPLEIQNYLQSSTLAGTQDVNTQLAALINLALTFLAAIADNEWLVGDEMVLSPKKYFIIITGLFGNGQSSSPSNTDTKPFPDCTFYDNVRAQHKVNGLTLSSLFLLSAMGIVPY